MNCTIRSAVTVDKSILDFGDAKLLPPACTQRISLDLHADIRELSVSPKNAWGGLNKVFESDTRHVFDVSVSAASVTKRSRSSIVVAGRVNGEPTIIIIDVHAGPTEGGT